jgi:polysaccharide pyruvyl transferase CsaB
MKIGIIGNYGATNTGDDGILEAILRQLKGHKVTIFSSNPGRTKGRFGVKAVPLFPLGFRSVLKRGFRTSRKAMKALDAVILGGGGLFQDDRLYACFLWAWQLFWVFFYEKPLFIWGTGVGPLNTWLGKKLTAWVYRHAQVITVRDEASKKVLDGLGVTEPHVHVTADPTFSFKVGDPVPERIKGLYAISVRPWRGANQKIIDVFVDFLLKLCNEKGATFVFVSMQQIKEADHPLVNTIMDRVGGDCVVPQDFTELLTVLRRVEFAVGMRYHFNIASLITQTPILPVGYSPKVAALYAGTNLEKYLVKLPDLSLGRLAEVLRHLSVDYNNVQVYQKQRVQELRDLAGRGEELFRRFLEAIKG